MTGAAVRGLSLEALESEVDRLAAIDPTELDDAGVNTLVAELAAAIDCLEAWRDAAMAVWLSRVGMLDQESSMTQENRAPRAICPRS